MQHEEIQFSYYENGIIKEITTTKGGNLLKLDKFRSDGVLESQANHTAAGLETIFFDSHGKMKRFKYERGPESFDFTFYDTIPVCFNVKYSTMLEYCVILKNGVISVESVWVNGARIRLYMRELDLTNYSHESLHSAHLIASELTLSSFISFYNKVIKPEYLQYE